MKKKPPPILTLVTQTPSGPIPPIKPVKRRGRKRLYIFRTIAEAERTLFRVANDVADREKTIRDQDIAKKNHADELVRVRKERADCQLRGDPPEVWPPEPMLVLPQIHGISPEVGGKIISAVNGFIMARRLVLSRELAERETEAEKRVKELEAEVRALLERLDTYRRQLAEAQARMQAQMQ